MFAVNLDRNWLDFLRFLGSCRVLFPRKHRALSLKVSNAMFKIDQQICLYSVSLAEVSKQSTWLEIHKVLQFAIIKQKRSRIRKIQYIKETYGNPYRSNPCASELITKKTCFFVRRIVDNFDTVSRITTYICLKCFNCG